MTTRRLALALVLAGLAAAPAAAADGPAAFAQQGGAGVLSSDGSLRYVALPSNGGANTVLETVSTKDGSIKGWQDIFGSYGLPALSYGASGESLSHDGRTLVLGQTSYGSSSGFLVYDTRDFRMRTGVVLHGHFSFDALSPDGRRMFLVQYVDANNQSRYVVRAYDLKTNSLLPGRIADRTQKSWVMEGYPVTRAVSGDGRWVYTLYTNGANGYPFVHALDTIRGVAHCVGLPLAKGEINGVYNVVLALHGRTLVAHWRSGRPLMKIDTTSWKVSRDTGDRLPWLWLLLGASLLVCASSMFWWLVRGRWAAASRRLWRRPAAASPSTTAHPVQ